MLPKYLKVQGFTSYIDAYIDFSSYGPLFSLVGDNGAGKSSIIDMITTCIFYRNRVTDSRGAGMDEVINSNMDHFEIEYVFEMNNSEYKIICRKFRAGAHELEFYINDINQSEKITDTQQKIYDIFKMDYDTFMDSSCIGQGESGRFMKKKPNERKEVFVQVLGLNKYEVLEEYTKNLKKETKAKIETISTKLQDLESIINLKSNYEDQLSEGNIEITQLDNNIKIKEEELEKIVKEKAQYEQIKKQQNLILEQRSTLNNKINTIISDIDKNIILRDSCSEKVLLKDDIQNKITSTQESIDNLQIKYTDLSSQKSSLETTNTMLLSQAREYKTKYDNLKNYNEATCNFCGGDITPNYKQKHLKELMDEGKKYLNQVNINKTKIETLNDEITVISSTLLKNRTNLNSLRSENNTILQAETKLSSLNSKITSLETDLEDYKNQYNKNIEIEIDLLDVKTFNDSILRSEIYNLRSQLTSWQSKVTIAEKELKTIYQSESDVDTYKNELDDLQLLYDDYDSLVTAYGKSGIQADIIANALPEIEEEINSLLSILSNNISIEFKTQKEAKTKKSKSKNVASIETLDIIINDETGSRVYESYSGGEKFRVDFACHVGLAKFLAKRAGSQIDFFVVDEGLGSQDQTAKDNFINSVNKLTTAFKKIMVITHIPDLQEAFVNKVLVEKDPIEGSQLRLLD